MKLLNILHSNPTYIWVSLIIAVCICIIFMIVFVVCRLESEKKITKSAQELSKITNSIHAGLVHFIPKDACKIHYASKGFYNLFGYSKKEAIEENKTRILDFIYSKDIDSFIMLFDSDRKEAINSEIRLVKKDGSLIYCLMNGNYVLGRDGNQSVSAVFVDITEQKKMQEMLRMDRERYRIASELSNDVLFEYLNASDEMIYTDKYVELFGRDPIISNFTKECFMRKDIVHPDDYGLFLDFCSKLSEGKEFVNAEFRIKDRLNDFIWCQVMGKTIYDEENKPIRVIGKIVNVDYQKRELDALEFKATRDPLTGVYNKEVTIKKIEKYIKGNKHGKHVLMLIDFDDFKKVNDNHGHLIGDKVLSYVIERIKSVFNEGEIIGRVGGDEFVAFIGYVESEEAIIGKANTLVSTLDATYFDENCSISISGSIGVAIYPDHGIRYEQLIQCADKALYCVKNSGKNSYMIYESTN